MIPRLLIWLSTTPCQVSFDLPPSDHHQFASQPQAYIHFREWIFMFTRGFIVTGLINCISTSDTLARASGDPRKETQETSPGFTTTAFNHVLPRLFMKCHNHPFFHSAPRDNSQFLLSCALKQPYLCTLCFEVFVHGLRIRIFSHDVVRVLSAGFCGCLLFPLCFFTNPRGSTFYV